MSRDLYPGLSPDPEATRILATDIVDEGVYDDIVWRTDHGYRGAVELDPDTGSRFYGERTVLDEETGRYRIVGTFAVHSELGNGNVSDVTHAAAVEATDVNWLHAAWRRVRRQPPAVVMTVWKVSEERDNPRPY